MKLQCRLSLQEPISCRKRHLAYRAPGKMAHRHDAMLAGANLWASNLRDAYLFDTYQAQVDWSGVGLTGLLLSGANLGTLQMQPEWQQGCHPSGAPV